MIRGGLIAALLLTACGLAGVVHAREVGPGYLELREIEAQHYDVL